MSYNYGSSYSNTQSTTDNTQSSTTDTTQSSTTTDTTQSINNIVMQNTIENTNTQNTLLFTFNPNLITVRENPRFNYLNGNNNIEKCTSNPINCNKRYKSHFRMPINHWRKKTNCAKKCLPNETIVKHNEHNCYSKQY